MLYLLNNLIKISGKQGGTIHQFINMQEVNVLDFFIEMNKTILINGYLSKERLLAYANVYGVTVTL